MTTLTLEAKNANGVTVSRWSPFTRNSVTLAREIQRNLGVAFIDGIVIPGFGIVRAGERAHLMTWIEDGAFVTGDVYALALNLHARSIAD